MATLTKLLRLPDRGRLLVAADLHGNLRDFLAIVAHFESLGDDAHLLFLGDLLHGPYVPLERWGESTLLRGRPYQDQSPAILLGLVELMARHPQRVFALLGNHEHAHIGGPRTSLFAHDEAAALEQRLGVETSSWLSQFLRDLPIWAVTGCGLLFSHAAPAALLEYPEDLELIDYRRVNPPVAGRLDGHGTRAGGAIDGATLLGQLLWTQSLGPQQADQVLARLGLHVAIYGHVVIPAGFQTIGQSQLILSSSFAMEDPYKKLLLIDLAGHYASVQALRVGHEIRPLYPLPVSTYDGSSSAVSVPFPSSREVTRPPLRYGRREQRS